MELAESHLTEILEQIRLMPAGTFYPAGAREAGEPYIECHRVAGGETMLTVWRADGLPCAVNCDLVPTAADAYFDELEDVGLYPATGAVFA